MKKILLTISVFLAACLTMIAQPEECRLRITLLTCAPGEELYSIFGHTAIRVQDSSFGSDQVFNYGTFEFGPDFYAKFIRGKLLYSLSVEEFNEFLFTYQLESRSVVEQEINLNCDQKKKLYTALLINAREENRHYRYDFIYDNCTTRARDMVKNEAGVSVVFQDILRGTKPSFRNLIHSYLDAGNQYWSKFGIDLLLGADLDKKVSNEEAMFLPDYLLKGFDRALIRSNGPLVSPVIPVLEMPSPLDGGYFFTPLVCFSILFIIILVLGFSPAFRFGKSLVVFDKIFFFILGLAGLVLLFMWFGTDHMLARKNYNLLWALPPHIVFCFMTGSNKDWVKKYFLFTMATGMIMLASWFIIPQQINVAVIPLLLIIILRSWKISKNH